MQSHRETDLDALESGAMNRSVSSITSPKMTGFLHKEGGSGIKRNWKNRFFVLDAEILYYFDSEAAKKPKGVLCLAKYKNCEAVDDKKESSKKNSFRICGDIDSTRVLLCSAASASERDTWIEQINTVIQSKFKAKYGSQGSERLETAIYVKIDQAKFTENKDEKRDTYCTIQMDKVQMARTTTIFQSETPLYGHECDLEVPPSVELVTVSVMELNKRRKNHVIGHALVPVEELRDQKVHTNWYPLQYVANQMEAGGQLEIKVTILPGLPERLELNVVSGKDLQGDHVSVVLTYGGTKHDVAQGDKDKRKNLNWSQIPTKIVKNGDNILKFEVFSGQNKEDFLGEVHITYAMITEYNDKACWWDLREREPADNDKKVVGQIKLTFQFKEAVLLPDSSYKNLFGLLLDDGMELSKRLASVSQNKEKPVAEALIKAFQMHRCAVHFIKAIIEIEVSETSSAQIIFRGNTVGTKALDMYMRLYKEYLHNCLFAIVQQINTDGGGLGGPRKRSCELDPSRLEEKDEKKAAKIIAKNAETLITYCEAILLSIRKSLDQNLVPQNFRIVFNHLQKTVVAKFPDDPNSRFTGPSGFIFLRYFCPALLSPKNFDLLKDHPTPLVARDLTLIAKTLQNSANLVLFGNKEAFMHPMNEWLEKNRNVIKDYINTLCTIPTVATDEAPTERTLNWGAEMARIHFHIEESLPKMIEKYGPFDDLVIKVEECLETLGQEVEVATGKTRGLRVKAPRAVVEEKDKQPPLSPTSLSTIPKQQSFGADLKTKLTKKSNTSKPQIPPSGSNDNIFLTVRRQLDTEEGKHQVAEIKKLDPYDILKKPEPSPAPEAKLEPSPAPEQPKSCHVCGAPFEPSEQILTHGMKHVHPHCEDLLSSESEEK